MIIKNWPIERVKPYDKNPRINDGAVDAVAASLAEFGWRQPIVVDAAGVIIAGHTRWKAAQKLGMKKAPVHVATDMSEAQVKAYRLADNQTASLAEWDYKLLPIEIADLQDMGFDLPTLGFSEEALAGIMGTASDGLTDADATPEPPVDPASRTGDLWLLGEHRLLCGDSTRATDVALLMVGCNAQLLHADPPYGMGKENDGIANDNLYAAKLDAFQMEWWSRFRPSLDDNAIAYIWGNAEDLWRLWYVGGLKGSERLTFRNEIVWDKASGEGMLSDGHRMYPTASERCLFFMLGEQGFNNNADNYWEGFEPIRSYLDGERQKAGWDNKKVAAFFGFHPRMADHWFSKSQWSFPTKGQYERLQKEAKGSAFKRDYDDLKREFYATRAYFDNTHDSMTDVWGFNRVTGEDRHGHATPKPVDMICRAIKSSTDKGAVVVDPFSGSGTTIIACEQLKRKCYAIEIEPRYVDVAVVRWQNYTGKQATLEATGETFEERSNA